MRRVTKVVHSKSKNAWNVVGDEVGGCFKYCRVPYIVLEEAQYSEELNTVNKYGALRRAKFISNAINEHGRDPASG